VEVDRVSSVLGKYARVMHEDYLRSRGSIIVRERSVLYSKLYRVAYLSPVEQVEPVVFVDGGRYDVETDVSMLSVVNLGSRIRVETGDLVTLSEYLGERDLPPLDALIIYSSMSIEGGNGLDVSFKTIIEPLDEHSFLLGGRSPEKLSSDITGVITRGISRPGESPRKIFRVLYRVHHFMTGLVELAYLIRILRRMGRGIGVLDGTLSRWFSVRGVRISGYDILALLSGMGRDELEGYLYRVVGLSKTTKFTNLARAFNLFSQYERRDYGAYSYVDSSSLREAKAVLEEIVRRSVDLGMETCRIFNRIVYPDKGIWVFRAPVTGDFSQIFHADYYTGKALINIEKSNGVIEADEKLADELGKRISYTITHVFAKRSSIAGLPPYGLMEVDLDARVDKYKSKSLHEVLLVKLREVTGKSDHPLIQVMETALRMRYGYR